MSLLCRRPAAAPAFCPAASAAAQAPRAARFPVVCSFVKPLQEAFAKAGRDMGTSFRQVWFLSSVETRELATSIAGVSVNVPAALSNLLKQLL